MHVQLKYDHTCTMFRIVDEIDNLFEIGVKSKKRRKDKYGVSEVIM